MNPISVAVTLTVAGLVVTLPRPLAAVPLLVAACYVTRDMAFELGPAHLTLLHIAVAAGFVRVIARHEWISGGTTAIDVLVVLGATVLLATGVLHKADGFIYRAGLVWLQVGCYLLFRIFLRDGHDVRRVFAALCVALLPLALFMVLEKVGGENYFAIVGGHREVTFRAATDQIRARGPFAHAILAGTVGATCFGIALGLWKHARLRSATGMLAALAIVWSATSSGPVLMLMSIALALLLYPFRGALPALRWTALLGLIALHFIMNDPVYFLTAKIDITGGSQGWYRAQLIRSSIEHINEWWLFGTDYTRHWMPSGTHANDVQADLTNYYLQMGVWGGLLLMLLFALTLLVAFRLVGRALRDARTVPPQRRFFVWSLGAVLFGQVVNMLSISLFDQSSVFLYLVLAAIAAVASRHAPSRVRVAPTPIARATSVTIRPAT
jgi:hypothetical protein